MAALCGEPGAGKSTLAHAMGAIVGCEVITENAAQWTTVDDLFWLCERIRSARMRGSFPLAFIDEVDASVQTQRVYAKLLSPVWDGAYFIHGEERTLGPTVFLLAGSGSPWHQKKALLKAVTEVAEPPGEKLPDLISRFSASPLEIPSLLDRKVDALYLAGHSFLHHFPRVRTVERGVLRLLAESECQHGARSITRVVETFGPLRVEDRVTTTDLHPDRRDELRLHIPQPIEDWDQDHTPVTLEL